MVNDNVIGDLIQAMQPEPVNTDTVYGAVASRVDDEGIVWVRMAGSEKETPTASSAAEVQRGDAVNVEWRNNKLHIAGNSTNPSAGVGSVKAIKDSALEAMDNAAIARASAESAQADAESAREAATGAKEITDEIIAYADTVDKTVTQILQDGETAGTAAQEAKDSADNARESADAAFTQLSYVEDIVGVLELLQKNGNYEVTKDTTPLEKKWYFLRHGADPNYQYEVVPNPSSIQYELTADETIDPNKTYYTKSGTGTSEDPYVYTPVESPVAGDLGTYYECIFYELVGIKESIQNYVASQLAVTEAGLWLKRPNSTGIQTKVLLSSTDGVVLFGTRGQVVGKYGEIAQIGDAAGFHIDIGAWYKLTEDDEIDAGKTYYTRSGTASNYVYTEVENPVVEYISTYYEKMPPEIGFYQKDKKVAYIRNDQLYITQTVVLQQMDLGTPVLNGGLGQWSWKVHANGQDPNRNNLNLKWMG